MHLHSDKEGLICDNFNSMRFGVNFNLIRHPVSASVLTVETMEALHSCLVVVRNHEKCIWIAPEAARDSGMNDCEWNVKVYN